jgi:hypothetical protein
MNYQNHEGISLKVSLYETRDEYFTRQGERQGKYKRDITAEQKAAKDRCSEMQSPVSRAWIADWSKLFFNQPERSCSRSLDFVLKYFRIRDVQSRI